MSTIRTLTAEPLAVRLFKPEKRRFSDLVRLWVETFKTLLSLLLTVYEINIHEYVHSLVMEMNITKSK